MISGLICKFIIVFVGRTCHPPSKQKNIVQSTVPVSPVLNLPSSPHPGLGKTSWCSHRSKEFLRLQMQSYVMRAVMLGIREILIFSRDFVPILPCRHFRVNRNNDHSRYKCDEEHEGPKSEGFIWLFHGDFFVRHIMTEVESLFECETLYLG
jgi:hypothetical protein